MKTLLTLILLFLSLNIFPTRAVDCASFSATTSEGGAFDPQKPEALKYILCPVISVVNVGLFASSALLIVMIGYGAIKASLSFGDPKALMGAKNTWTWAAIGTFLVVMTLALINMIFGALGYTGKSAIDIFNIDGAIDGLWEALTL